MEDLLEPTKTFEMADLHDTFAKLDKKIEELRKRLDRHRSYGTKNNKETHEHYSAKCSWVCKQEKDGKTRSRCLQQCSQPVITFESIESMEREFPVDVKRLRSDLTLRQTFERHQRAPLTIKHSKTEASDISDIYAMPISTIALPELSWDQAMDVMKNEEYKPHLKKLVQNWSDRSRDYSEPAKEELIRKIQRHDSHEIIQQAINEKE